jgi:hypothetical protein
MVLIIHPMQQFSPAAEQGTVILLGIRRLRVTLLTYPEFNGLAPVPWRLRVTAGTGYFRHQENSTNSPYNQKFAGENGGNPLSAGEGVC